ncbi:3beta-hydroxysteroid dehydrogenase [Tieghemostelium lacteum]|uniref:3beta-hydroxysteroid dehydrogenase n=1 Tax=Tieghemostelium lacteum TaxID=361077 RepID=A0A151Z987_TIELA|nr:3beta-hydroxysteroid dehydrogenase [Tieghemostelium lacteum]|eukprot:KYQ90424.1 3beta-hydroxysteroid dehydrogenase [Tieghemostelium lacteum]
MNKSNKSYLVVGGCGFLGRYIVESLLARGEKNVSVFDIRQSFEDSRVKFHIGDIRKKEDLLKACEGVTTVFHTASPTHGMGYDIYYSVNVVGTEKLVEACVESQVKQLIYTSSSSVVFNGEDIDGGDETLPYVQHHIDPYNKTKELGEKSVISRNGKNGLLTCSLRPAGIFGPREVQGWPQYLKAAKEGKNKFMFGSGQNRCDWTYIDNVVHAHILAADKMVDGSKIPGSIYFITNDEPINFWEMPLYAYEAFGYDKPSLRIPYPIMYAIAWIIDTIVMLLSPFVKIHPTITLFRIVYSSSTRVFNIQKAKDELSYRPIVSIKEGMERTKNWFLANYPQFIRKSSTKQEQVENKKSN